MTRPRKSSPATTPELGTRLADAVEKLSEELRALNDTLEEIREEISWVTRNGLPVQPVEHVIVKRMAKDPLAGDWAEKLEVVRLRSPESRNSSDIEAIERVAAGIRSALTLISEEQVEHVLAALDLVREALLDVDHDGIEREALSAAPASLVNSSSPEAPVASSPPPISTPRPKPPHGRLF